MWAQQLKKTCQGKECQSLYYTSKPQFSTTRSSSALDTTDERSAARSVGGNRCLLLAGFWIAFLLLKCPFIPVFQEHPAQFSESTLCHTEEPIPLFFISKRSTAHNDPQWSGGAADQTWRPRKVAAVIQMPSRLIFFSFLSFFFVFIRQEQWNKGKLHLLSPICPNILSGIKNTSTDTLIRLRAGDLLLARPLWHSHPLGISPKVRTLNILDLGQRHCPRGGEGEQECWPAIPPVSAVWAITSNQCYRLPFPVMGKWPLPLEQSPPHHHHHTNTWPVAKGWGRLVGRPIMLS